MNGLPFNPAHFAGTMLNKIWACNEGKFKSWVFILNYFDKIYVN